MRDTFSFYPKPSVLGFLIRFLRLEIQLIPWTLRQEVTFSKLSLNRDSSQARGPFSSQTKQPWALWSLINNFHPAITLPDSLQLDRHKETLRRKERKQVGETDGLANKSFRWERARQSKQTVKKSEAGDLSFWEKEGSCGRERGAINFKSSLYL